MAKLLKGSEVALKVQKTIKDTIVNFPRKPGLAVVLVGNRKDSESYVKRKRQAALEVGFKDIDINLPENIREEELANVVRQLNTDNSVDGILVQLPLPNEINESRILSEISIDKDVDGFHPENFGRLCMRNRTPLFVPCTPKGIIELLDYYNIEISGKYGVVLGRSNLVGIPISMLLLHRDATVTMCHSKTKNLEEIVRRADILVACLGSAHFVPGSWLKKGVVVIDVGVNSIPDKTKKSGFRLVGDVIFEEAVNVASWITPVPGGVGPLTVAMLLKNTMESCRRRISESISHSSITTSSLQTAVGATMTANSGVEQTMNINAI